MKIWTDNAEAGMLDRFKNRDSPLAAILATTEEVRAYIKEDPPFAGIGNRMLQQWEHGSALSLRAA